MILEKPCIKKVSAEFVSVGDLLNFVKENKVSPNTMIWIDFGDGNGAFLRTDAGKNWKTNKSITMDGGTLRFNLSPSCLTWHDINTLHPVVLSVDKCN